MSDGSARGRPAVDQAASHAPAREVTATAARADGAPASVRQPFYPRLLHLRHVHPNAWQRAALGEGAAATGGLLALADLASAWSVVVLPVAVAVVVKAHDLLAGYLARRT